MGWLRVKLSFVLLQSVNILASYEPLMHVLDHVLSELVIFLPIA